MRGYNMLEEEKFMRALWLVAFLLVVVLLASPRALYACPS